MNTDKAKSSTEPIDQTRRRLAKGGIAASAVVASLATKNALACSGYNLTLSGKLSGTNSNQTDCVATFSCDYPPSHYTSSSNCKKTSLIRPCDRDWDRYGVCKKDWRNGTTKSKSKNDKGIATAYTGCATDRFAKTFNECFNQAGTPKVYCNQYGKRQGLSSQGYSGSTTTYFDTKNGGKWVKDDYYSSSARYWKCKTSSAALGTADRDDEATLADVINCHFSQDSFWKGFDGADDASTYAGRCAVLYLNAESANDNKETGYPVTREEVKTIYNCISNNKPYIHNDGREISCEDLKTWVRTLCGS